MYDQQRAQQPATGGQRPRRDSSAPRPGHQPERLLSRAERDELAARLSRAAEMFADDPRQGVEAADSALADAVTQLTAALAARQQGLRARWQGGSADAPGESESDSESDSESGSEPKPEPESAGAGTSGEELRLALREYEQLTERLLRI
ncbi:hypothetical protein DVA86_14045 [Streptomyces armeniacus]|uniref:Uncharacterized protein n=2 Tax=Streptomyces armeniacus TaxID=83291 RepID=A0A345Y0A8_9ACTN|nr:hypothetical protein DVA86_14045 [Streptomyces armeniacus]